MELPQSRPFGADQGSKSTHDFLSLYTHSSPQQDPRPSPQGGYLKTHNFLQPHERKRKVITKEETDGERPPPPPVPPPWPSIENFLTRGIETYSISHVSYFNQRFQPKPEGLVFAGAQSSSSTVERNNENSNAASFTTPENKLTQTEERAVKKGKTGMENTVRDRPYEGGASRSQWTAAMERPSQSSSNNQPIGKRNPSFMEMLKSAKSTSQDEELDDDDDDEFDIKKEELRIDVDGNRFDRKANTPRSKHSVTEQRRRSKINHRFQMLRDVIPQSDQKRDKASFLLEVVEYIKFLQEKVQNYEGSYQRINQRSAKFVEKNAPSSSSLVPGSSHYADDSNTNSATTLNAVDPQPGSINNAVPFPLNAVDSEAGYFDSDVAVASEIQKEQDLTIEGGTINISSVYSQGLLNTLTHALHSLGVDLSQARISVQIELGKQANRRATAPTSIDKDVDTPINDAKTIDSRVLAAEDSERATKKLNTFKS